MKIELIIVTFEKEYNKLLLLLNSIELYANNIFENILIVLQGQSNSKFKEILLEYLKNRNFSFINILKVKEQYEYINFKFESDYSGWYIQQILKVLAAKNSSCDYSYILDTKQFFVNNFNISDIFIDRLPITELIKIDWPEDSYMFLANKNCYNEVCLNYLDFKDKSLGVLTPYIFINKIVRDCVTFLEEKYKLQFYQIFMDLKLTEFYMYEAFLHANYKVNEIYSIQKNNITKIIWDHNVKNLDYYLKQIESEDVKIFGIHKSAHNVLNLTEKEKLKALCTSKVPNYLFNNSIYNYD